jgi:hypothetical protein
VLATLLALLLGPAPAGAEPIADGQTSFRLDRALYERLQANGVRVERLKPGKADRRVVTLPVSSGLLEPTYGSGYLYYAGGVRLRAGGHRVVLKRLVLNTAEHWLRGRVAGRELTVASVLDQRVGHNGFDIEVGTKLRLSGGAATLLDRRLGLPGLFRGGQPLAGANTVARPETVSVGGGTITLSLDPRFLAKLGQLGIAVGPSEGATQLDGSPPTFSIPVLNGSIAPDLSSGALVCQGGLVFSEDGSPPRQARFIGLSLALDSDRLAAAIDVDPRPMDGALFGTAPLAAVDFGAVTPQVDPGAGSIAAPGVAATLEPYAAAPLNEAFPAPPAQPPSFTAGEPFATVSFSVH